MMKILVIEDDLVSRKLLENILSKHGQCDSVVNGKEAIEAYEEAINNNKRYDLLCLDIMMPELDGREVLKIIRAKENQSKEITRTRIIMTSAIEDIKLISNLESECDGIVPKPIDINLINNKIKQLFETK